MILNKLSVTRWAAMITALSTAHGIAAFTVSGRILEQATGEPLPTTIYHIYEENDTIRPIINGVNNDDGTFKQKLPHSGSFTLKTNYIGMVPATRQFEVTPDMPDINLGDIEVIASDATLEEVTVTAKKALIASDGANLKYNVQDDPASQSNTVLEMLRKVPMVTVDGEDNIRVNGSTDFRIYLNGKPNPMFSSNPQQVLRAMPASSITRIEVLTEPGAKYDAEGLGGILNIVIESGNVQATDGYSGSVTASASTRDLSGNLYLRGKLHNVTADAQATYSNSRMWNRKGFTSTESIYHNNDTYHKQRTDYEMPDGHPYDYAQGNFNMSWEPNADNLITASLNLMRVNGGQSLNGFSYMDSADGTRVWSMHTNMDANMNMRSLTANLDYQHSFHRADHTLSASLQYFRHRQRFEILRKNYDYVGMPAEDNVSNDDVDNHNNEYTLQLDYRNSLNEHHTVEAGAKGVLTDNNNESTRLAGSTTSDMTNDEDDYVKMRQYRDIGAVYGAYTLSYSPLNVTAGLRYEYTHLGIDFRSGDREDFGSHLSDLVPNASVSYNLTPFSTLRLAYNMRISRPSIEQLNPFQLEMTQNNIRTGNPNLSSQRSNNVSLGISGFGSTLSWNARAEYQHVGNLIGSYTHVEGQTIYETYLNIGRKNKYDFSGFVNWNISPRLSSTLSGNIGYTELSMNSMSLSNHGWSGGFNASVNYTMPLDIRLSAYGGYSTWEVSLQSSPSSWHYYGIGLSRDFLRDKKLRISLSASNMFEHYTTWKYTVKTDQVTTTSIGKMQQWSVGISAMWSFGTLKQTVKKINSKIDNDDSQKTDNHQGGGIL